MAGEHAADLKLVTIVTEASIETPLLADLDRLGVHGYTVMDSRGKGSHGVRSGSWVASANIRVETICDQSVAAAIFKHIRDAYAQHYAIIAFSHSVDVLQPEKF